MHAFTSPPAQTPSGPLFFVHGNPTQFPTTSKPAQSSLPTVVAQEREPPLLLSLTDGSPSPIARRPHADAATLSFLSPRSLFPRSHGCPCSSRPSQSSKETQRPRQPAQRAPRTPFLSPDSCFCRTRARAMPGPTQLTRRRGHPRKPHRLPLPRHADARHVPQPARTPTIAVHPTREGRSPSAHAIKSPMVETLGRP